MTSTVWLQVSPLASRQTSARLSSCHGGGGVELHRGGRSHLHGSVGHLHGGVRGNGDVFGGASTSLQREGCHDSQSNGHKCAEELHDGKLKCKKAARELSSYCEHRLKG